MRIGIDMGHSLTGAGSGAVGVKSETEMNRLVGKRLITMLREKGHTVVNCTVDSASSVDNQLAGIVNKANAQTLDYFVSLHLNSYKDATANGVETYIYNGSYKTKEANRAFAKRINDELVSKVKWKDRGVKEANYYVLRATVAQAVLVELGFCSNKDDMAKWNTEIIAKALFKGITNSDYKAATSTPTVSGCDKSAAEKAKSGKATITEPLGIIFRDKHCTHCGTKQGTYEKNEYVFYDKVCETDKYTWISWIGANGARRWMPVVDKRTGEKWVTGV